MILDLLESFEMESELDIKNKEIFFLLKKEIM